MGAVLNVCFKRGVLLSAPPQPPRSRDFVGDQRVEPNPEDIFEMYNHRIEGLKARFGDSPPKKGVIYKQKLSASTVAFDSYGWGCVHNSIHQYSPKKGELWNSPIPMPCDLHAVDALLKSRKGEVLRVGYKSDPFMWMDSKYSITKSIIKLATKYGVQLEFHTMSDLCAQNDYIDLIKEGGHTVYIHMGFEELFKVETGMLDRRTCPGAPSRARRQSAFEKMHNHGVRVFVEFSSLKDLLKDEAKLRRVNRALGTHFNTEIQFRKFCEEQGNRW